MQQVDPLSLFISHLSPRCEVFSHIQLSAPWGIAEQKQDVCCFSYVKAGYCVVELDSGQSVSLRAGQLLLLPYGTAHKLMSASGVHCVSSQILFSSHLSGLAQHPVLGGAGASCEMMCGCFVFAPIQYWGGDGLSNALPELIVLQAPEQSKLATLLTWIYEENATPAAGQHLAQKGLLELLLLEVLRHLDTAEIFPGWLQALHDRALAPVILAIQAQANKDWCIDELARLAAMSKSAFSARFKQVTGLSPLSFVRQWRCQVAATLLVSGNQPLKSIAAAVGFQSADVLIRNFRQFHHMTPRQFRKTHQVIQSN